MPSSERKSKFLGMPYGTAMNRLRKELLFSLVQRMGLDICFKCGNKILEPKHMSIEHKEPWEGRNKELFWDLDNIAFSHLSCNRRTLTSNHGMVSYYGNHKCRCDLCKEAAKLDTRRKRAAHKNLGL